MEVVGFNMIHWLTGSLPWLGITNNPGKVHAAKEDYMKNLAKNIMSLPKQVQYFMKYVAELKFEEEPDYNRLRGFFTAEVKKSGGHLDLGGDVCEVTKTKVKKVVKKAAVASDEEDIVSEKENKKSPVKRVRKAVAKKAAAVETDSENDIEPSPVPAKKAKKAPVKKVIKKSSMTDSEGDSEDMFSSSPSPLKKLPALTIPKYQEAACQTSPAFVAAARAAKRGLKALAQSEDKVNGDTPVKARNTPGRAAKDTPGKDAAKSTPTRAGRSSAKSTPSKTNSIGESSVTIPGISNPTPAMLAIFLKKQKAEEEKAGKKRKK